MTLKRRDGVGACLLLLSLTSCSYVENIFVTQKSDNRDQSGLIGDGNKSEDQQDDSNQVGIEIPAELDVDDVIDQVYNETDINSSTTYLRVIDDRNERDRDGQLLPEEYSLAYAIYPDITLNPSTPSTSPTKTAFRGHRLLPCGPEGDDSVFYKRITGYQFNESDSPVVASTSDIFAMAESDTAPPLPCGTITEEYATLWFFDEGSKRDFYLRFEEDQSEYYRVSTLFAEGLGFNLTEVAAARESVVPEGGGAPTQGDLKYALDTRPDAWTFLCIDQDRCLDQPPTISLDIASLEHQSVYPGQIPDAIKLIGMDPEGHEITWKVDVDSVSTCTDFGVVAVDDGTTGKEYTITPTSASSLSQICRFTVTATSNDKSVTQELAIKVLPDLAGWCKEADTTAGNDDGKFLSDDERETIRLLIRHSPDTDIDDTKTHWTSAECDDLQTSWANITRLEEESPLDQIVLSGLDSVDHLLSDLSPLATLSHLKVISLPGRGLTDVRALGDITSLESIELSGNDITDVSALLKLVNLRELYLYGNKITHFDGTENAVWQQLETLDVGGNPIESATVFQEANKLPLLVDLNMQNTQTDYNRLVLVQKSTTTILADNAAPTDPPTQSTLKYLDLSLNNIADFDPFTMSLVQIKDLNVAHNEALSNFSPLATLERLDILETGNTNCGHLDSCQSETYDEICSYYKALNPEITCDDDNS